MTSVTSTVCSSRRSRIDSLTSTLTSVIGGQTPSDLHRHVIHMCIDMQDIHASKTPTHEKLSEIKIKICSMRLDREFDHFLGLC